MADQLTIRGFDPALWEIVRIEAVKQHRAAGQVLNDIVREWAERLSDQPTPTR